MYATTSTPRIIVTSSPKEVQMYIIVTYRLNNVIVVTLDQSTLSSNHKLIIIISIFVTVAVVSVS